MRLVKGKGPANFLPPRALAQRRGMFFSWIFLPARDAAFRGVHPRSAYLLHIHLSDYTFKIHHWLFFIPL